MFLKEKSTITGAFGGACLTKVEPTYSFVTSYMDIFPINSCPLTPVMSK